MIISCFDLWSPFNVRAVPGIQVSRPNIAMHRVASTIILGALIMVAFVPTAAAQEEGPIAPPPKFEVKRIPSVPHPGPPPIPEQEIIRRFAANEDLLKKVYETYIFTQTIRIDEVADKGGTFAVTGEEYTRPDGGRFWRVLKPAQSTLKFVKYSLEDVRAMVSTPLFFLTTEELGNYDLRYAGQQQLDELQTYIFQVKPKQVSRTRLLFQGVVFVDDHDFAIVESYGKFVIESEREGEGTKLPFTLLETFRQNFQEKYWLPTYTRSEDDVQDPEGGEVHLRLVIRSSNFLLNAPSSPVPSPSTPSSPGGPPPAGQTRPPN